MSVRHQVSDELLMDYASGSLGESWSLAVSTHLALCPESRQRLEAMEMTGGALLTAIEPADRSVDADWEKIRGLLSANVTPSPAKAVAPKTDDAILPEPLRSYAGGDVDKLKWKQLGPGAYHFPIRTRDGEANVRLLRIPAGKPVPEHTHGGRELTVVLSGYFKDGNDVFRRGDFEEADEDLMHQPVAGEGEDCICLAVTDAPLKFKSWVVRLLQPVLGI
ncbi:MULTISPECIES: ChrR family anti-sigma-E factor [unclassified Rhizobium]|uniref:ChrR family anti-sigma-E factor n=1 Tax=unclassified Rhizobium TaxID=2613769 RepID=UPI001784D377|nr:MULTISPECIES: ChrR family anti-sigma-E factor [unclassified Rhizobium]MBD8686050.1 cupin domain-containing protein [Rhizobium sp. CFBP 13644]MBD8690277.1 cupin domain-containing protein [Rhizobium sp. CFBP 13717]